jgi:hypothetical protein
MGSAAIASVVIVLVAITAAKLLGLDSARAYWILSALCAGAVIVVVVDVVKRRRG